MDKAIIDQDIEDRIKHRFAGYPLLTEFFPLALVNGSSVAGVVATCSRCYGTVSPGLLRGEVREVPNNSFRVTAIGHCVQCDLLSPYLFHVVPLGEKYKFIPLDFRGWPEQYDSTVIDMMSRTQKVVA